MLPSESFIMENFVSAVLGDLIGRSVSFLIDRYYRRHKDMEENLQRLHRVLLRIQATVDEAGRRNITNQAMLQQLQMLREAMYKGCYLLDTLRHRRLQQEKSNGQVGAHSFALSKFISAKRFCSNRNMDRAFQGEGVNELQKMIRRLHDIIDDMAEFITFLNSYPPINHGPYNSYLFLENCMFGRQTEMERIITFLLQPESPSAESLQVLPIVGPARVGKSTLVEHALHDERVHKHFSLIILCSGDPTTTEGSGVVKHQTHGSRKRSLVIMELADDFVLDERQCKKFLSSRRHMPPGSKIIVTSRSESILKHGTTGPLKLDFFPREAFWYFFKVLAFGSTNPEDHPELASIALEISELQDRSFVAANTLSAFLRDNINARFWRKILGLHRNNVEWHIRQFGEHPHKLLQEKQAAHIWSMSNISVRLKVRYCQTRCADEVPKIMMREVQTGSVKAPGEFEVIVWKSSIPPYHSYPMNCEILAPEHWMSKKKRSYSEV